WMALPFRMQCAVGSQSRSTGHVRATQGIDLLIEDHRLDAIRRVLGELGYLHPSSAVLFHPPDGFAISMVRHADLVTMKREQSTSGCER
ncbi:MAG: hypothetical protein AAF488_19840, partial [Planctomycetota bacterium]